LVKKPIIEDNIQRFVRRNNIHIPRNVIPIFFYLFQRLRYFSGLAIDAYQPAHFIDIFPFSEQYQNIFFFSRFKIYKCLNAHAVIGFIFYFARKFFPLQSGRRFNASVPAEKFFPIRGNIIISVIHIKENQIPLEMISHNVLRYDRFCQFINAGYKRMLCILAMHAKRQFKESRNGKVPRLRSRVLYRKPEKFYLASHGDEHKQLMFDGAVVMLENGIPFSVPHNIRMIIAQRIRSRRP